MVVARNEGWSGRWRSLGAIRLVATAALLAACTSPPRDPDLMVWSRPGWDPGQEQLDHAECFESAKRVAYRNLHWKRLSVSREVEQVASIDPPAGVLSRLHAIAAEEKAMAASLAEQCMISRGYALVPIDKAP